jgi:RHS repeat-associated protein
MALFNAASYFWPCKGSYILAHKLSKYPLKAGVFLLGLLVFASPVVNAQTAPSDTAADQTGVQPFGSFSGGGEDRIDLTNGTVTVDYPILSYPQRGSLHLSYHLVVDNKLQHYAALCASPDPCEWDWGYFQSFFHRPTAGGLVWADPVTLWGNISPKSNTIDRITYNWYYANWFVTDAFGAEHFLGNQATTTSWSSPDGGVTNYQVSPGPFEAIDATGWRALGSETASVGNPTGGAPTAIIGPDGLRYTSSTMEDPNGNLISWNSSTITDSLGRQIPLAPSTGSTSRCPSGRLGVASATTWSPPGSNGSTLLYTLCFATVTPNMGASTLQGGTTIWNSFSPATRLQSIVLPNGQSWEFEYNDPDATLTYNGSPVTYGTLSKVTLPTGGVITYTYATVLRGVYPPAQACQNGGRWVTARTVTDENGSHTWNYNYQNGYTVVTDPMGNDTKHTFGLESLRQCRFVETQTDSYQGSYTANNLIKTVATTFSTSTSRNTDLAGLVPTTVTTTWYNGANTIVSKVTKSYDSGFSYLDYWGSTTDTVPYGKPLVETAYDYGSGAAGAVLKQTNTSYQFLSNSNYQTANLLNLPSSVIVYNASGHKCAETDFGYDDTSRLFSSSITTQHTTAPNSVRGNLSSTTRQLSATPCQSGVTWSSISSYTNMYDTGVIYQSVLPYKDTTHFATTTYTYAATLYAGAFPTTIANALSQNTIKTYDLNTGLVTSVEDPNLLTTTYTYDNMARLIQTSEPDGGQTTNCYTDEGGTGCSESSPPFKLVTTKNINSTQNEIATTVFDVMGRKVQSQLNSDPQGTVYVDTTYDALGRVATVSNPYRSGTDPTTSLGTTTYSYDALGRKTQETYADSAALKTAYCANYTVVTDPTSKWRRSKVDGLGRLVEVDEPNALGATLSSTCPGTNDPVQVTSYTFDSLGDMTLVSQYGSHNRSFSYDSLSRMLTSNNPEVGTITYTYNADNTVNTKKDARSITITYTYDQLYRELTRTYSNGDPSLSFTYDQTGCISLSTCQNIGHRTSMTDGAGSESWAYEVDKTNLRSIHQEKRTTNSSPSNVTKTTTYYLNLAGNVTQLVYPTGRTVNYTYDSADRPSTAADSSNGITYATDWKTPGTGCLANAACYTPQGSVYNMSIGQSTSFTGFNLSETFNNRLQPLEIKASSTAGTAMDLTYSFNQGSTGPNAGHVGTITNNLDNTRGQGFSYDQVNRVSEGGTVVDTGVHCWGYQYSYDAWGNLLAQAAITQYYGTCTQGNMAPVTADGNNHITGLSYDASGNTLSDGSYSYTWDGESQMKTAAGVTYAYDGDGRRVAKVGSQLYWYGSGGEVLSETDASGNTLNEYIFFGGKRVAAVPASGSALYYAEDSLGSSRVIVQSNGTLCYDADFVPFGGERAYTNSCAQNYKFEGKERDTETQNDNFGAREYSWRFGRWLSADWSALPVPVPYANLTNPQTLNLYSMVADDPESFADLDGHMFWAPFLGNGPIGDISFLIASGAGPSENSQGLAYFGSADPENDPNQSPQNLANQVPPAMKAAIVDALNASNAPTDDDKKGGFHEESVKSGKDAAGNVVVSPSVPGPYAQPGTDPHTGFKAANSKTDEKLVTVDVFAHIHPKGDADRRFNQFASPKDIAGARDSPNAINLVVGAQDKKVYFFNASGPIGSPMKLKDFMRGPQ